MNRAMRRLLNAGAGELQHGGYRTADPGRLQLLTPGGRW